MNSNTLRFARRMSERTANMATTTAGITIGIQTVPRMRIDMTADALRLQAALLAKPRSPEFYLNFAYAAIAVFLVVMAAFRWLPGEGA